MNAHPKLPTVTGRCAFCETPAAECRKRAPAYCCAECIHPESVPVPDTGAELDVED